MNGIILYGSRYGASQQYAQALEGRTGLPAVSYNEIKDFSPFDTIVYIGGVYAGRTVGLAKTVGLSDPSNEDSMLNIREHLAEELTPAIFIRTAHVHLRGAMDYSILQPKDKLMMKGFCTILRRQPVHERSAETQAILDGYGKAVDYIDFDALRPIQEWLESGSK